MEEIITSYDAATKSLERLSSATVKLKNKLYSLDYEEMRDCVIQRFEFSIDALQKFLKSYAVGVHGLNADIMSPRNILRSSLNIKLISRNQFDSLLTALEDRNRTSHTYDEALAETIAKRIYQHEKIMKEVLNSFAQENNKIIFIKHDSSN